MTENEKLLRRLAEGMATANPDAAEYLAEQMAGLARMAKAPLGFGIVVHYNDVREQIEIRGGDIAGGYWRGEPGAQYAEVIHPVPRLGTRKT